MSDPIGYAECQICDQPAVKACQLAWMDATDKKRRDTLLLCGHHVVLLGKHKNFTAALEARHHAAKAQK